jgi:phosphonate transport system permease protein
MREATAAVEQTYRLQRRRRRATRLVYAAVLLACLWACADLCEVSPRALWEGAPRAWKYFAKLVPDLRWHGLFGGSQTEGAIAYWMYRIRSWSWLLFETSQMALLATLGGALLGAVLCFPAAANLAPNRITYVACRRILELFRCVPDIVYALILVWTFGIGPLAGILAIGLHTVGAIGKLFAEVVENADMRPWEGVLASGGSWLQAVRFAIIPQVLPNFLSYLLVRFEINVRGATVIGFVGAGGIGQELYTVISFNYYQEISAIVVLIIVAVGAIDLSSEWLRSLAIGRA